MLKIGRSIKFSSNLSRNPLSSSATRGNPCKWGRGLVFPLQKNSIRPRIGDISGKGDFYRSFKDVKLLIALTPAHPTSKPILSHYLS